MTSDTAAKSIILFTEVFVIYSKASIDKRTAAVFDLTWHRAVGDEHLAIVIGPAALRRASRKPSSLTGVAAIWRREYKSLNIVC